MINKKKFALKIQYYIFMYIQNLDIILTDLKQVGIGIT